MSCLLELGDARHCYQVLVSRASSCVVKRLLYIYTLVHDLTIYMLYTVHHYRQSPKLSRCLDIIILDNPSIVVHLPMARCIQHWKAFSRQHICTLLRCTSKTQDLAIIHRPLVFPAGLHPTSWCINLHPPLKLGHERYSPVRGDLGASSGILVEICAELEPMLSNKNHLSTRHTALVVTHVVLFRFSFPTTNGTRSIH